jgi:hypothetical protein
MNKGTALRLKPAASITGSNTFTPTAKRPGLRYNMALWSAPTGNSGTSEGGLYKPWHPSPCRFRACRVPYLHKTEMKVSRQQNRSTTHKHTHTHTHTHTPDLHSHPGSGQGNLSWPGGNTSRSAFFLGSYFVLRW